AGTVMVEETNPTGNASSSPGDFLAVGSVLYFSANDGGGPALWTSNGTSAGTTLTFDINPSGDPGIAEMTLFGGIAYFRANDGVAHGADLWRSNGTSKGTLLGNDIETGSEGYNANIHEADSSAG